MYTCVDCNLMFSEGSEAFHHLIDVHEDASPKVKERLHALFDFQMLHYTGALKPDELSSDNQAPRLAL